MLYPGRRSRKLERISKAILLCFLTILSFLMSVPLHVGATPDSASVGGRASPGVFGSQLPQTVGADSVPSLTLPQTLVSRVNSPVVSGGVIQSTPDNLTLYNEAVSMRLLGGRYPRDQLLGLGGKILSADTFWQVEVPFNGLWVPMVPISSSFSVLGTNSTGTSVVRTMQLQIGGFSGLLKITYRALSTGPLKWSLAFTPSVSASYRLSYDSWNVTSIISLSPVSRQFHARYSTGEYTFSWSDLPSPVNASASVWASRFMLTIPLGNVSSGDTVSVDPTISKNVSPNSSAYTFQRKVYYEPKGGYYFVFYSFGSSAGYSYSRDGTNWSGGPMPPNWPVYSNDWSSIPTLYASGQTIVIAVGETKSDTRPVPWYDSANLYYAVGNITGANISWGVTQSITVDYLTGNFNCNAVGSTGYCHMLWGIRYVSVTANTKGFVAFSMNAFAQICASPQNVYNCGSFSESSRVLSWDNGVMLQLPTSSNCGSGCSRNWPNIDDQLKSVVLPIQSSQGAIRVVYENSLHWQQFTGTVETKLEIDSAWFSGSSYGTAVVEPTLLDTTLTTYTSPDFSAVIDATFNEHLVYPGWGGNVPDGTVHYAYQPSTIANAWTGQQIPLPALVSSPTVTVDYSTGNLYVFALQGTSIVMKEKVVGETWWDSSPVYPVNTLYNATNLGSNFASASASNSTYASIIWTVGTNPYTLYFASVPLQTVWSPYAFPRDPWDGNGLVPYGQYFANLGESVSPSGGMLTIRQTDLSVPGRGINLDITRVYTEPQSFLGGAPSSYDSYPWAPIGDGWQLSFPWLSNATAPNPIYVHLGDGEGYRIPVGFWNGVSSNFENHQGENFGLARYTNGTIVLFLAGGSFYTFDSSHRLLRSADSTGNDTITFRYNMANQIANVTDTIGRVFLFCYNTKGRLASIEQSSGTCGTGYVRRALYSYNSASLANATDPAGRVTKYQYAAVSDTNVAPWILSRVTYATQWYTNYTYTMATMGTQASAYRVLQQLVESGSNQIVRKFAYSYSTDGGDRIANSFVLAYNGTATVPASNTTYTFSFAGLTMNITDGTHKFIRGLQQLFGVQGEVTKEIVLVPDGSGQIGSYSNYYTYDLWGNRIYSRTAINPSLNWYHESFNAYYNDGLPPGFRAFQETFNENNKTATDNRWTTYNGTWLVTNGVYNGTSQVYNPPNQDVFAWNDIGESDISILASINITKPMLSSDQRVGLIAHYPGSGVNKWALVLHNTTSGVNLSLLDGANWQDRSCMSSMKTNVWYTFNFTLKGTSAWGSMTSPSVSCNIAGTFPSTDSNTAATGFGLYAGGYDALFANVTVSRLAPGIIGATITNSFYTNGTPGPRIHNSVAGTAELQNGTAPAPIETYYSYDYTGHPLQTNELYNSPTGIQWIASSKTYDVYGNVLIITVPRGNSTTYSYSSSYRNACLTSVTQILKPGSTPITSSYSYNFTTGTRLSSVDPNGYNTTYQYDILGRLTRVTYPNGDLESDVYNDAANYVNSTNEMGLKTQQVYDGLGRLNMVRRFSGNTAYSNETYSYNWQDKTTTDRDPVGRTTTYQYDPLARNTLITKPDLNTTSIVYNDLNSTTRFVNEQGVSRCNIYDRLGRLISVIEYADSNCRPIILAGATYVTNYYYDEVGNLLKTVAADYNLLTNPGFETGDFTGWTEAEWFLRAYAAHSGQYGAWRGGLMPASLQQNLASPISGNTVKVFQFWYQSWSTSLYSVVLYSDNTNTTTSIPIAHQWTLANFTYDRTKQIVGFKIVNVSCCYTVYADDFVLSTAGFTTYSFDNLNRLVQTSHSDGTSESYSYDKNSNVVTRIDRKNAQTTYSYDSLNRVANITYYGATTKDQYNYDKNGNLLSLKSQNATLTYTYDSRDRVVCQTYQVNGASQISGPCGTGGGGGSVAAGTLITLIDGTRVPVQNLEAGMRLLAYNVTTGQFAVSTITRMTTVETDNMLIIQTQDGQPLRTDNATIQKLWVKRADASVSWLSVTMLRAGDSLFLAQSQRWTPVTSVKEAPGQFVMYDIYTTAPFDYIANGYLDPPKSPSTPGGIVAGGYSFQYYYTAGALKQITYDDYSNVVYNYDSVARVLNLTYGTTSGSAYYARFSYYPNDELKGVQYGNGLITNYTYNKLGLVSRETVNNTSTYPYLILNYRYNTTGTVATVTGQVYHTNILEQYSYDVLQRLINAYLKNNSTVTTLSYVYDNVGNRLSQAINGSSTSYSYNTTNNELTGSTVSGSMTSSYSYDPNGNLVSKNLAGKVWTYSWDVHGSLINVSNSSGVQGYYAYDGLGRRVESKEGSFTTFYAYSGTEALAEGSLSPYTDYIYANGLRIARVTNAQSGTPTVVYFSTDDLGSTRLVTDANRIVMFSDSYQPHGQDNTSTGTETYKFTGKPYSTATGLYYDYQRWYDPTIGRFVSADPQTGQISDPETLNPYTYALNAPTNYFDPDGGSPVSVLWRALVILGELSTMGDVVRIRWQLRSILAIQTLPLRREGGLPHTLFEIYRPKIPGGRDTQMLLKVDRPDPLAKYAPEQDFHLRIGEAGKPRSIGPAGDLAEFLLFHADRALLVAGIAYSGYRIWSAYQSDVASGDGYANTIQTTAEEAFSWGGATAGCYLGAALGSVVPGPGTAAGCFVGGFIGGIYGEQALQTILEPHWGFSGNDPPMVFWTRFGRSIGWN